jgi:hypothetical protein
MDDRGQLPVTAIEAAVGVVLVLGVTVGFALGVPTNDGSERQLDAYAEDTATILSNEPPRHLGGTRLTEVTASADAFKRERASLRRRVERILPANLMFQVQTDHGTVGHTKPAGVTTGTDTVTTKHGDVTIRVWFA